MLIFLVLLGRTDRLNTRLFNTVADIRGLGPKMTPATEGLSGGSIYIPGPLRRAWFK